MLAKLGTKLGGTLKDIADIGSENVLDDIGKGSSAKGLIGKDFEDYLTKELGGKEVSKLKVVILIED
ncbi:hypothetical protein ACFSCX_16250 [Bacillus salitolerans]|uniref:Uncharacterized protein n=1 Tax=Bacillus salitolerans TaxID=1437434 RepID=A0ABW4LUB6_9BACI